MQHGKRFPANNLPEAKAGGKALAARDCTKFGRRNVSHEQGRHGRACPDHPRLSCQMAKDVDARHKAGHDGERVSFADTLSSKGRRKEEEAPFHSAIPSRKVAHQPEAHP
jgi:hypothetical protein